MRAQLKLIKKIVIQLQTPSTEEEWKKIADDFETKWNFPNCVGALDGKHVVIKAPVNTGSANFNYKGTFSVVLMALVDANYKFIYVNIGAKGSGSDGGIFSNCALSTGLETNSLNLPPNRPLPGREIPVPFCIVADEAFASSMRIMKPIGRRNLSMCKRRVLAASDLLEWKRSHQLVLLSERSECERLHASK